jgi:transcriptional regulator with GAF, ATPase, and Fis domain
MTLVLARRIVAPEEAEQLAEEVVGFVDRELGLDYPWPGNVRELEQCVRSVLLHGSYCPPALDVKDAGDDGISNALREGLSADDLLRRYVTHAYARVGSYEAAARCLGLDRRTVKAKLDPDLLARLKQAH